MSFALRINFKGVTTIRRLIQPLNSVQTTGKNIPSKKPRGNRRIISQIDTPRNYPRRNLFQRPAINKLIFISTDFRFVFSRFKIFQAMLKTVKN